MLDISPYKPISIVRLDDLTEAVRISEALLEGGISAVEFTLTGRGALEAMRSVAGALGERVVLGAGTVLTPEEAQACAEAGARFIAMPALLPDVVRAGREAGMAVICGAFTPTEILLAVRAGADFVKLFPARSLGPSYIKDVLGPLPDVKLVPTGGVDLDNCRAFLDAGAYTVGIGGNLVSKDVIARRDWAALTQMARLYVRACEGTIA